MNTSFTWEGYGGYVAKGVGTFGSTSGIISIQGIPQGASIEQAYIYWMCYPAQGPDTSISLDGIGLTGTQIGVDGIWYTFRTDITNHITGNGNYSITDIDAYGTSIVVVYSHPTSDHVMVFINDGMETFSEESLPHWLDETTFSGFVASSDPTAMVTFIMGDGQIYYQGATRYDKYSFYGNIIAIDDADGSDGNSYTHGWDTDSYDVSVYVSQGDTSATANVYEENDELGWTTCIFSVTTVLPFIPPVANTGPDQVVDEGDIVNFDGSGSIDQDGTIVIYEWDFDDSDGLWWDTAAAPDATGPTPTHNYGDNGFFKVTLRVWDDHNATDIDTCNITVQNVDPTLTLGELDTEMDFQLGLRVAGRKFNDVGMTLYEDGIPIGYLSVERLPGSPDDQMVWLPVTLDFTKFYSATLTFLPEDPPNIGANPVWVYIKHENGSIKKLHHTFNVQQSKKRDSDHWNHVDPWEVDISGNLTGCIVELPSQITDPGSDDEILNLTYGTQAMTYSYLNDPPNPDPFPSPEVHPRDINEVLTFNYEGPGTIQLTAYDDDGGSVSASLFIG